MVDRHFFGEFPIDRPFNPDDPLPDEPTHVLHVVNVFSKEVALHLTHKIINRKNGK
jgi:hypothetical protein